MNGEQIKLWGIENIWGQLAIEIAQNCDKFTHFKRALPNQWIDRVSKNTTVGWKSKDKYIEKTVSRSDGKTDLILKNYGSLIAFSERVAKALKTHVDWQASNCNWRAQSGIPNEDGSVILINTSGGEKLFSVCIDSFPKRKEEAKLLPNAGQKTVVESE